MYVNRFLPRGKPFFLTATDSSHWLWHRALTLTLASPERGSHNLLLADRPDECGPTRLRYPMRCGPARMNAQSGSCEPFYFIDSSASCQAKKNTQTVLPKNAMEFHRHLLEKRAVFSLGEDGPWR